VNEGNGKNTTGEERGRHLNYEFQTATAENADSDLGLNKEKAVNTEGISTPNDGESLSDFSSIMGMDSEGVSIKGIKVSAGHVRDNLKAKKTHQVETYLTSGSYGLCAIDAVGVRGWTQTGFLFRYGGEG
jgi:hypothetical protein